MQTEFVEEGLTEQNFQQNEMDNQDQRDPSIQLLESREALREHPSYFNSSENLITPDAFVNL